MIKVHYKLVTDTGKGKLEYEVIPDFKALDNISLIEAPNDSGKSTLLHCLAISCYGEQTSFIKDKITDPGLLEKIDWLVNPSPTDVEFDITIDAHGTTFQAKKELNRKSIERFIDGKRATFEDFKEKFDIVYQIPSDPVRRLNDIIKDVINNVKYYGGLFSGHHENIGKIIENLDQDPKDRIEKIQERIAKLNEQKNTLSTKLKNVKDEEKAIEKYLPILQVKDFNKELITLNNKISTQEKQITSSRSKAKARSTTIEKITSFNNDIRKLTKDYLNLIEGLDLGNVDINNNITILRDMNILNDFKSNKGKTYWDLITDLNEAVQDEDETLVDDKKTENAEYLQQLKSFLETFPTAIDDESITTPVDILLKEINKFLARYSDSEYKIVFDQIYVIFNNIDSLMDSGVKAYERYNNLPEEDKGAIDQDGIHNDIKDLKKEIKEIEKSKTKAIEKLVFYEFDEEDKRENFRIFFMEKYSKYRHYKLKKLESKLEELTQNRKGTEKDIRGIDIKIESRENEKDDLKDKERDEFSDNKDELENIESLIQDLKFKLENEIIVHLERQDRSNSINKLEENFKEQLQIFLAKKIPDIPINEDGEEIKLKVKRIDHINKTFITEDDRKIDFRMYGSGRTSSLGYISTINNLNPEKLTILLLDEALMDDTSLAPLKKAINKQYNNGILFAGILARYYKTTNVESLIVYEK